jgi:hypothetical protein
MKLNNPYWCPIVDPILTIDIMLGSWRKNFSHKKESHSDPLLSAKKSIKILFLFSEVDRKANKFPLISHFTFKARSYLHTT